jgi:hypothetical protein
MTKPPLGTSLTIVWLALSTLLGACGLGDRRGDAAVIAVDALLADPQEYAGQYLCTAGVQASGFELNGLAASSYEKDGYTRLAEPVIWLEDADVESREDCSRTDTLPSYEFCQATVCGIFDTVGHYGHVGAYAYQLRGRDVPAPPAVASPAAGPFSDMEPVKPVEDRPTVTPVASPGPPPRPPEAILEIDGQTQVSGVGSYCWTAVTAEGATLAACADTFGTITSEEPLSVPGTFTARIRLALEEEPVELVLRLWPVGGLAESATPHPGWRAWQPQDGERYVLSPEQEPEVALNLAPGLHVLDLFVRWEGGDVSYGFLVEVQDQVDRAVEAFTRLPALVVDETPVVAAEVDGPGHFEYMDRLGEEILTRIEGLRDLAGERRLARINAALAPFGYRLEAPFDAEWDRTFYELFRQGQKQPLASRLSRVWSPSVSASGTDFSMAAEDAASSYWLVHADGMYPWDDAQRSNWLPPLYVGDALARVTFTGYPTITYQVKLEDQPVYSGTAIGYGAYMPLRSFATWDGHWILEVDDHLIVDGQDLAQAQGYDAAYGFALIHDQPFYFFEQHSKVRISYDGQTLPNVYDEVFHNMCCEAAMFNVEAHADFVLFHALWNGTWYSVEAGVYDGEMAGTWRYAAAEGWSFHFPAHWNRLDEELGYVQDPFTGKTVTFASALTSQAELERWIESEITRKLGATEAENTLPEPLSVRQARDLTVYRYAIRSRIESSETLLRTTIFFDGHRRYQFEAAIPPVAEEEYEAILASFRPADG